MPTTAEAAVPSASAEALRRAAAAELASGLAAWFLVALVEAIAVSLDAPRLEAWSLWAALRITLPWTLTLAAPAWIFALLLGGASLALSFGEKMGETRRRRALVAVVLAASAALAVTVHTVLGSYPPFLWHAPFLAAGALFFAAIGIGHLGALLPRDRSTRRQRVFGAVWPIVGIGGFAAVHGASTIFFPCQYPTLHLAALLWACALLHLGVVSLAARRRSWSRPRLANAAALIAVAAIAAPAAVAPPDLVERARMSAAGSSTLGEARLVGLSFDPKSEDASRGEVPAEPRAAELFARMSGLPTLPDGFRLEDYNVLLVTSESTRFDQTSLGDGALATTPNLAALVRDGAFSFDRAFSPSSGTLHSIAAILCMTFPSMIRLESWQKAWHGRLLPEEETVPELFARAGYDTFLASHDHKHVFHKAINGFEQGFARSRYIFETGSDKDSLRTDADVADAAIEELARAAEGRRFFGWVFFASPHSDYFARYDDMPARTDLERYRHDVRFMDEQLGRVVAALRDRGLFERTIIVFAGDHGEEFGEHGGTHHKTTVFSESIRVPLVVRIPGVRGGSVRAPASTLYTFPWLAARGPEPLSRAAATRVAEEIAPLLRATEGAVVVELVGHDRMLSALVYRDEKINYDFITGRITIFDTRTDAFEHRDLFDDRPDLAKDAARKVRAYTRVRASKRRYSLLPDLETPR